MEDTSYDSGNISLNFPTGAVIWVMLEQPGACSESEPGNLPWYLNGSIRYHPTSS